MIRALALGLVLAAGSALPSTADTAPLPFDLGGPFELIDQTGRTRTEADPDGRHQLLFFGYANCREICSAALPLMADVADLVAAEGMGVSPVMITVDPVRDTVETLGPPLALIHPGLIGLTGSEAQLARAYDAFGIEIEEVFVDPEYGPVYAHGSFIYLLDPEGEFLTLLPPVLPPGELARIVAGYIEGTS